MGTNGALTKDNPQRAIRDRTIAAERLNGKTYRELAEQFGLSKSAIQNILNDDEIRDVIETGTKQMVSLVPKAVGNYEQLLDSADEKIKLQASKDCLQTTGIMPSHTQSPVMINILNQQVNPAQTKELAQIAAFLQHQWESDVIDDTPDDKKG
ncbi:MAG: hypothetical protein V2A70_09670 [Candidatus Omnitrophota bacterium]